MQADMAERKRTRETEPPAVVIGATLPGTTSLVRSLGRRGISVTLIDRRDGVPMSSRFASEQVIVPESALEGEQEARFDERRRLPSDWLVEHLLSGYPEGTVLISGSDEASWFLAHEHDRLSERFVVTTAPWERMAELWQKTTAWTLAEAAGCASPEWYEPDTVAEFEAIARSLDFDNRHWMIRAEAWSTGATSPAGQLTMPAGPSADSMIERALGFHERTGSLPTISEVIPGPTSSCFGVALVVGPGGDVLVEYSLRRLEVYPYVAVGPDAPNQPGGVVAAETHHDPEAIAVAKKMAAATGYTGAAMFEFRRRPDGELVFLKIDPRVCNTLALSSSIGQDEAIALYDGFLGRTTTGPGSYRDGLGWIWAGAYVFGSRRRRARLSYSRQLGFLARHMLRVRAAGDLSWTDPRPMLNSFGRGVRALRS